MIFFLSQVLKERFGVVCLLGLTATATMVTAASVSQHLGIKNFAAATIRGNPVPGNLHLSVSRDEERGEVGDKACTITVMRESFIICSLVFCWPSTN